VGVGGKAAPPAAGTPAAGEGPARIDRDLAKIERALGLKHDPDKK
jgi:hypothetical protein